jgi:NAD(P)-dependent dehydrogenase (short-subunit alcohol dehydrogenase family)
MALKACWLFSLVHSAMSLSTPSPRKTFVILGGTGKIGTAVAAHLSRRAPGSDIVLVGRQPQDRGEKAIQSVRSMSNDHNTATTLSYQRVHDVWSFQTMADLLSTLQASCVIHIAGPYADRTPTVLDAAIAAQIPVYVDVSDPVPFLADSLKRMEAAIASGTTALCAAGAFPGMSNVLAMEGADNIEGPVQDVRFNYFTKGLGGSGTINLYITNIGFGEPMIQHDKGQRKYFNELSGKLLGTIDFFINQIDAVPDDKIDENERAKRRVGTQKVFAWPFPEAATVASELSIQGSSSAAMGTAPDVWNDMLGLLVNIVPQPWWTSERFSKFMADFSQPLVRVTDAWIFWSIRNQRESSCQSSATATK